MEIVMKIMPEHPMQKPYRILKGKKLEEKPTNNRHLNESGSTNQLKLITLNRPTKKQKTTEKWKKKMGKEKKEIFRRDGEREDEKENKQEHHHFSRRRGKEKRERLFYFLDELVQQSRFKDKHQPKRR